MKGVIVQRKASIERCARQARKFYAERDETSFSTDFMRQDAIAPNVLRACEQSIDLANMVVRLQKLGAPASSREAFELFARAGIIPPERCEQLCNMVGFRNRLVHEYQQFDFSRLVDAVENRLSDLLEFSDAMFRRFNDD